MYPFLYLGVFWLLHLAVTPVEDSPMDYIPRRSVPRDGDNAHLFREEGVFNYSTMLLREDLNLLVVGAREVIYALDLRDISKKQASVKWEAAREIRKICLKAGIYAEANCKNYIRILHKMDDNKMYVCGTNAFDPVCYYMSYTNGQLTLEEKEEDGTKKCPSDPFQRYASIMFENSLYSATFANYMGLVPGLMRNFPDTIRTEYDYFWLNDPTFISMTVMPESEMSVEGDDDKIYLFFSEKAVENDYYKEVTVSRVARVCKGDLGGQKILHRKWTSFLKARMDCPVLESQLPNIIQDTYHWCDPQERWKDCLLYAIFTPQSATSDLSAVCVYSFSNISRVFAEGKYMTPVIVDTTSVKWDKYSGDVPVIRPGACIDNKARNAGISTSLDLPDSTLQFVQLRPLMDQAILPIGEKPLLVRSGATFTHIIVNQVQAADGEKHHVMFIGTEEGTLLKAVNYDGEMFIIEEVQLFQPRVAIKILRISNVTLYAGSDHGAAQVPLATCGRSLTCMDCVLARDPYCGWDKAAGKCSLLTESQTDQIQSVKDGNASLCPDAIPAEPLNRSIWPGEDLKLHCSLPSNLAETVWELDGTVLTPTGHFQFLPDGLLIVNASYSDTGRYRCMSVETSKAGTYTTTVAEYMVNIGPGGCKVEEPIRLQAKENDPSVVILSVVIVFLSVFLLVLLIWNGYRGNIPLPFNHRKKSIELKREHVNLEYCHGYYKESAQTEESILQSAQTEGSILESTDNFKAPARTEETTWSLQTTIKYLHGQS